MTQRHWSPTFSEMAENIASDDPIALVLSWWRRLELALAYYTMAYHGRKMPKAVDAIRRIEADGRLDPLVVARLHQLRIQRNAIAHGNSRSFSADEAVRYASEALMLIGLVGNSVPDQLALSSGAADVA